MLVERARLLDELELLRTDSKRGKEEKGEEERDAERNGAKELGELRSILDKIFDRTRVHVNKHGKMTKDIIGVSSSISFFPSCSLRGGNRKFIQLP